MLNINAMLGEILKSVFRSRCSVFTVENVTLTPPPLAVLPSFAILMAVYCWLGIVVKCNVIQDMTMRSCLIFLTLLMDYISLYCCLLIQSCTELPFFA